MAEVTARIKLRTVLPSGKTVSSDDYYLEEGEMYIAGTGTNEINIYIGAKNGSSLIPISGIKPIVLTKTNQGNYEPKTIGGFTNNGTSLSGGTLGETTSTDMTFSADAIKKLCLDTENGNANIGTEIPSSGTSGQLFFITES